MNYSFFLSHKGSANKTFFLFFFPPVLIVWAKLCPLDAGSIFVLKKKRILFNSVSIKVCCHTSTTRFGPRTDTKTCWIGNSDHGRATVFTTRFLFQLTIFIQLKCGVFFPDTITQPWFTVLFQQRFRIGIPDVRVCMYSACCSPTWVHRKNLGNHSEVNNIDIAHCSACVRKKKSEKQNWLNYFSLKQLPVNLSQH